MSRAPERDTSVRERILDAALSLLGRPGAFNLSQPQVAREAGVPQGHLTYYFPKKLDLLVAVAEEYNHKNLGLIEKALAKPVDDPMERLSVVEAMVRSPESSRAFARMIVMADGIPEVAAVFRRAAMAYHRMIGEALGSDPEDVGPSLLGALYTGLAVEGILLGRSEDEANILLDALRRHVIETQKG